MQLLRYTANPNPSVANDEYIKNKRTFFALMPNLISKTRTYIKPVFFEVMSQAIKVNLAYCKISNFKLKAVEKSISENKGYLFQISLFTHPDHH